LDQVANKLIFVIIFMASEVDYGWFMKFQN